MGKSIYRCQKHSRAFLLCGMLFFVLVFTACGEKEETTPVSVISIKEIPAEIETTEEDEVLFEENKEEIGETQISEESKEKVYDPVGEPKLVLETPTENKYTRLKEGYIGKYEAGTSNGYVFPFEMTVTKLERFWETEYKKKFGFVDETGMIVSDYGYSNVKQSENHWTVCDNDNCYIISKDGKSVLTIKNASRFWRLENLFESKNYVFQVTDRWSDNSDYLECIDVEKYDYKGTLLEKKEYPLHLFGTPWGLNEGGCEDIFNDRFALINICKDDRIYNDVFDMEKNIFILEDIDYRCVLFCDNNTFIVSDEANSGYRLYDVNGNQFGNYSYKHMEYLNDDFYYVIDADSIKKIIKLSEKGLTEVHRIDQNEENENIHCGKSYFALSSDSVHWEFYDFYGKTIEPKTNAEADAFKNYSRYGLYKDILVDAATLDSSYPIYYDANDNNIINLNTGENVWRNTEGDYYDNDWSIINGIYSDWNRLIDLEKGEVIFYYKPLIWENIE